MKTAPTATAVLPPDNLPEPVMTGPLSGAMVSQTPFTGADTDNAFDVLASGGGFFYNGPTASTLTRLETMTAALISV